MQPLLRGGSLFPAANKKALTWDNSDHPARGSAEEGSGPGWLNGGGGGGGVQVVQLVQLSFWSRMLTLEGAVP